MSENLYFWIGFNIFVLLMLALDLGIFHRKTHAISVKEALIWSGVWIALALLFNVVIYITKGPQTALAFFSGYLIEKSLSIDNIFVFLMIFIYFDIPARFQHKILFWGILAALVMRAIFIAMGIALIQEFHWIIYIFGGILILTGIKMGVHGNQKIDLDQNPVIKLCQKYLPLINLPDDERFFVRHNGRLFVTPLFIVLILINVMDIIFAVDSVPAVFSVTLDPFIVYSSNVFAILGLRALYFALAGIMPLFVYLNYGLSAILVFVGIKMLLQDIYHIPTVVALGCITSILFIAIFMSRIIPLKKTPASKETAIQELN